MYPMTGDIGVDLYKGWTPRRQFYKPSPHRFTRIRSRDNTSFIIYIYEFFFFYTHNNYTPFTEPYNIYLLHVMCVYCRSCIAITTSGPYYIIRWSASYWILCIIVIFFFFFHKRSHRVPSYRRNKLQYSCILIIRGRHSISTWIILSMNFINYG